MDFRKQGFSLLRDMCDHSSSLKTGDHTVKMKISLIFPYDREGEIRLQMHPDTSVEHVGDGLC